MALPWPQYWEHIPQSDRDAVTDLLTRLLAHGALIGDEGRERQLYLLARTELEAEIESYFAPLGLSVFYDPDAPIIQLRPVESACGLSGRFNKAETLVLLTLWRRYHDIRMETVTPAVLMTVRDLWDTLKVYFEEIQPPNESQLKIILNKLKQHRLIRMQRASDVAIFEEMTLEILPTLQRVIPFEDSTAWQAQCDLYRGGTQLDEEESKDEGELS
jgi:hypothetical protein